MIQIGYNPKTKVVKYSMPKNKIHFENDVAYFWLDEGDALSLASQTNVEIYAHVDEPEHYKEDDIF